MLNFMIKKIQTNLFLDKFHVVFFYCGVFWRLYIYYN